MRELLDHLATATNALMDAARLADAWHGDETALPLWDATERVQALYEAYKAQRPLPPVNTTPASAPNIALERAVREWNDRMGGWEGLEEILFVHGRMSNASGTEVQA